MILAGDIGGSSARLAFFEVEDGRLRLAAQQTFPSREFKSLDDIVTTFVAAHQLKIEQACFGIAGPVRHGVVQTPNLAWVVDSRTLAAKLGLPAVKLINDLEANAWGIAELEPKDFVTLNEDAVSQGRHGGAHHGTLSGAQKCSTSRVVRRLDAYASQDGGKQ